MKAMPEDLWRRQKRLAIQRLWEDLEIGYLDKDLLPVLVLVNRDERYYTKSSCSGRIVISDSTTPWSREETGTVFKKHVEVSVEELEHVLATRPVRSFWLNVSGPIVHLSARSLAAAIEMLRIARRAGYKHSGILSLNPRKGVVVELRTGVRMSHLLATQGGVLVRGRQLEEVVEAANRILMKGKEFLERLYVEASRELPREVDAEFEGSDLARAASARARSPLELYREMLSESRRTHASGP
ncbi:MAG: hypothetical protein ABWK00_05280 [Desulfurococcaceae archaeon]